MTLSSDVTKYPARILIVDDERTNRDLIGIMLKPEGYLVLMAASGEEALAIVQERPPDLILLDILMPGLNGYQLTRYLKGGAATKNIPVIMITAIDDRSARMDGLHAGAEDFLTKPVDRAELCVRVRNLLRLKAYGDYYDKYSEMLEREVVSRTSDLMERTTTLEQHAVALHRNDERMNYALDVAGMGIWEVDLATQALTWSDTMAPLFGLTPAQAPSTVADFMGLIHPDDLQMVGTSFAQAASGIGDFDAEFRLLLPDGSIRWNLGRARVMRDVHGVPTRMLGVGTDVSDRRSLETQLRQAQKMDAVGQLAGGIAHDFNNLLTAIMGYSNFVIDSLGLQDERRSDMEEVISAAERASALTRQLLAFSRKQVLQPTVVDLNELVLGIRQMLSRLIGEQVDLVPILAADLCTVRADHGQLEQVLMNLVVNARDAMPMGGRVTVETANVELDESSMRDVVVRAGAYVMLAVSDSGVGMTEATKQRLFEPFFTTKEHGKGTGLGLATAYGIVHQSGGYIWVYSEPGQGATFKVYLPCIDGQSNTDQNVVIDRLSQSGTETVLVVEDEEPVRLLTRRILERAGYRVFDAADAQQAEALFDSDEAVVNLLVTDVVMPGSSGPLLFERLSRKRRDLKVLYVSGYTNDSIVLQGHLGADVEFLQKPFTADALTRRIREVLDRTLAPC
jgi:two-component system cell cycle sensor histidine kinase/response regulator CckA